MIGNLIVAAMETSLLALQATRVVVMPFLDLVEAGKAARQNYLSCDDLVLPFGSKTSRHDDQT
jgi:hypothetical protein